MRTLRGLLTLSVAMATAGLAPAGCAPKPPPGGLPLLGGEPASSAVREAAATPSQIQSALMTRCDNATSVIADAVARVEANSPDVRGLLYAQSKRLATVSAILTIGSDSNPLVGFIDLYVLLVLQRDVMDGARARAALSESDRIILREAFARAAEELRSALATTLVPEQLKTLDELIARWRAENPDQDIVSFVRLTDFARERQLTLEPTQRGALPSNLYGLFLLDPLSGLDPTVREIERARLTAERTLYWLKRVPITLGWQAELAITRSLDRPQITAFLADGMRFSTASTQIADASRQFAAAGMKFADASENAAGDVGAQGKLLLEQMEGILNEQVSRANAQVFERLAVERKAALEQTDQILAKRLDVTTAQLFDRLDVERRAALDQAAALITREREAVFSEVTTARVWMRDLLNHAALLAAAVIAFAAVAYLVVGLGVRRANRPR